MEMIMKPTGSLIMGAMVCAIASTAAWTQTTLDESAYVAVNGRTVRIGSFGNLVAFQSAPGLEDIQVKRSREGYIVAYKLGTTPRIVFNVHDVPISDTIWPGRPDFLQESFTAPPAGHGIPSDTRLRATAVVQTRDKALRITRVFEWTAGYGPMDITTTVKALLPVYISTIKLEMDPDVAGKMLNDCTRTPANAPASTPASTPTGATCMATLTSVRGSDVGPDCPWWDPDCVPNYGLRAVPFSASPRPSYVSIRRWDDESEHYTVGLATFSNRLGYRANEDNQITLGWILNLNVPAGKSIDRLRSTVGNP
jgi:hypothetical protein